MTTFNRDEVARLSAELAKAADLSYATPLLRNLALAASQQLAGACEEVERLRAERDKRDRHPMAPERCPECEWTNVGLINYSLVPNNGGRWACHACAAYLIADRDRLAARVAELEGEVCGLVERHATSMLRTQLATVKRARDELADMCDGYEYTLSKLGHYDGCDVDTSGTARIDALRRMGGDK